MLNHLSPFSASTSWLSEIAAGQCTEKIRSWLYDPRSLTEKLEKSCHKFDVQVNQQLTLNSADPKLSHYFNNKDKIFVRDVFLCCDDIPVVFAQTEMPLSTLTGQQAQLTEIGSQSLGKLLFQDPSMYRGVIEVAKFTKNSPVKALCSSIGQCCADDLWARRSVFYLNAKPLLVSELFLPASGIYTQ